MTYSPSLQTSVFTAINVRTQSMYIVERRSPTAAVHCQAALLPKPNSKHWLACQSAAELLPLLDWSWASTACKLPSPWMQRPAQRGVLLPLPLPALPAPAPVPAAAPAALHPAASAGRPGAACPQKTAAQPALTAGPHTPVQQQQQQLKSIPLISLQSAVDVGGQTSAPEPNASR